MKRMLSGIKPTGQLTLGNYIGALKNFVAYQDDYGMIDGVINNGKADRIKDAEEKRPSVLEQLKAEPPQIGHPERPRRPEERNIG